MPAGLILSLGLDVPQHLSGFIFAASNAKTHIRSCETVFEIAEPSSDHGELRQLRQVQFLPKYFLGQDSLEIKRRPKQCVQRH